MAQLKGKGSMTGVNLVAVAYDNNSTKNGKSHYLDVQIDHRDSRGPVQTNLHLRSERSKDANGKDRVNNGAPYSTDQVDKIVEAAGRNVKPLYNKNKEEVGKVYGLKANLMPASNGSGLVINTDSVEKSDFALYKNTVEKQYDSMKNARDSRQAESAAAKEAPAKEAVAEKTVEEEPAFG